MRENRLDRITDKLKLRVGRVLLNAHKQFKGTNPYRMERIPDKERLYEYDSLTNEEMEFGMQNFSQEVSEYSATMEELRRKYA